METDSQPKENGIDSMDSSTNESNDNAKDKNVSDDESKTDAETKTNCEQVMEISETEAESDEKQDQTTEKVLEDSGGVIENGLDTNDSNINDTQNEIQNENDSESAANCASQNDEEDEDDFNPLLLCPDISMDVDESPVVTTPLVDSGPASAPNDLSDEPNSLFTPLFSTFVDEMTGAEISFNLTSEEQQLREKLYGPNNPIQFSKVHCTACNVHLGSAIGGQTNRFVHPLLKVLICKECYHFYTSGEFEKDEDGSELYCRWCGQGGQVLCCTMCEFVFCKKCIRINFGRKKLTEVRDSDDWKCFRCDISQLKALRAMCVEFFEYIRRETARASTVSDPDFINRDLTNCCQSQMKKRIGETEEAEKEVRKPKRSKRNEEDPDYNPFAAQAEREEDSPVPSTSGINTNSIVSRPLPPLIPKPTLAASEVTFPGQSPSPTVRIGNTVLNVKSTTTFPRGAVPNLTARASNSPVRSPQTVVTSRSRPSCTTRTPIQTDSPRSSVTTPMVGSLAHIRANTPSNSSTIKHEWFEKTVRAAARVNSNLSYTLTQLNKAQASASSVEQLAVVHNKLQEILSSSINSLIQIRKNLRTEFIAGIKTIRFPPKKPVDPNDDDVIIVNSTNPSVSQVNKNMLAALPQITLKKTPKASPPFKSASKNIVNSGSTSNSTPTRTYLKVKTFSQLQTVPSECITIPDDDPPPNEKDDDPVIVSQNMMPEMDKDPLADDLGSEEDPKKTSDSEDTRSTDKDCNSNTKEKEAVVNVDKDEETTATTKKKDDKQVSKDTDENDEVEKNSTDKEKNCIEDKDGDKVIEINSEEKVDEDEEGKEPENSQRKEENAIDENNKTKEGNEKNDETRKNSNSENDTDKNSNGRIENENSESNSSEKLSNGTSDDGEVRVKLEPEENNQSYNVKEKPSPKIRRMLSVKVNLKKTPVVEDMVKQEPVENACE